MIANSYTFSCSDDLILSSGEKLASFELAYETYGTLNHAKSNAILVCHALTGDAHAAFENSDGQKGWWDDFIGPGKAVDTDRFFVICSNTLGSCNGSTGPTSKSPSGEPYGLNFPVITIEDMVSAQKRLIDHLEIPQLFALLGPSMGGMQALVWTTTYPEYVNRCVILASAAKLSEQALAFSAVGRNAIISDTQWNKGHYTSESVPIKGLSIARMIGHITYLSEESMSKKFGRKLQEKEDYGYELNTDFQVESYLQYQGDKFVSRFDANSYLYLSKAMSYFDLTKTFGSLDAAFKNTTSEFLVISITSDWLYPTKQSREIAKTLMRLNKPVSFCEVDSGYGHDSFLIDHKKFEYLVKPFLERESS